MSFFRGTVIALFSSCYILSIGGFKLSQYIKRPYNFAARVSISDIEEGEVLPKWPKSLFIFGLGYVGTEVALRLAEERAFRVSGSCTNVKKIATLERMGITSYLFDGTSRMFQQDAIQALLNATHILSTVPPDENGEPIINHHHVDLKRLATEGRLEWIGYLSSTGVYGERSGSWVTEEDEVRPTSRKTKNRFQAEQSWTVLKEKFGLPVHIFRLAGIYGPGRSALDTLAKFNGDMRQCGSNDQTFISRIHVNDIVTVLKASMLSPSPGLLINVADDLPSTRYDVLSFACRLLNYPLQAPDNEGKTDDRSTGIRGGSKRVDNSRMRALLARTNSNLKYSDYRSGLQSIFYGDFYRAESPSVDEATQVEALEDGDADEEFISPDSGSTPPSASKSKPKSAMREIKEFTERLAHFGEEKVNESKSRNEMSAQLLKIEDKLTSLVESNRRLQELVSSLSDLIHEKTK